ncbi:MAG: hypothetical protein JWM28_3977 [Chitinophagaceae bacterium]|nr:hypothetical protein [Chitinophagaceae bacterium]
MAKQINSFAAASLIMKYLKGELSEAETIELEKWLSTNEQNQKLFNELCAAETVERSIQKFEGSNTELGWQRLQDKMTANSLKNRKQNRKGWWRAAAAILIIVFGAWQIFYHSKGRSPVKESLTSRYGADALPGTPQAQLVLSDGTTIILSAGRDSMLADNGNRIQLTAEGGIVYEKGTAVNTEAWNTIHVPNGGQYTATLEDGTKVWMNAATTLRYPVQFTGNERKVELTEGEAYFEIAKNKEKPFIVLAPHMDVQAVGTAFNVNSYADGEIGTETTLVEGTVRVKALNKTSTLRPGEQITTGQATSTIAIADVETVTAWHQGLFLFNGKSLSEVMKQLARWYDVSIEYDQGFKEQKFFTGEIKRNVPVSKLLQMMELTGIAKFKIKDNVILVLPQTP